jgi:hypothetical protein
VFSPFLVAATANPLGGMGLLLPGVPLMVFLGSVPLYLRGTGLLLLGVAWSLNAETAFEIGSEGVATRTVCSEVTILYSAQQITTVR